MIKLEMVWHDNREEKPAKNGKYIAITSNGYKDAFEYAEGYWNAHIDYHGVLHKDHAMDNIIWWAEFPELPISEVEA